MGPDKIIDGEPPFRHSTDAYLSIPSRISSWPLWKAAHLAESNCGGARFVQVGLHAADVETRECQRLKPDLRMSEADGLTYENVRLRPNVRNRELLRQHGEKTPVSGETVTGLKCRLCGKLAL